MNNNTNDRLREQIISAGLTPPNDITIDGVIHRWSSDGKRSKDEWYVAYPGDVVFGSFGSWSGEGGGKLCSKEPSTLSRAESEALRTRATEAKAKAEKEREQIQREAATREAERYKQASHLPPDNPYIKRKGVKPHPVLRSYGDALLAPMVDEDGKVWSTQEIRPDGWKGFAKDGRVHGCFCSFKAENSDKLFIGEGVATMLTVHEATDETAIAAFTCHNLKPVAEAVRKTRPDAEIIIVGDDDGIKHEGTGLNPGKISAEEAAKAVGARVVLPVFKDTSTKPTDFNDIHRKEGIEEVRRQLERAVEINETNDEAVERLAKLSLLEYEQHREAEAKKLGVRAVMLDIAVKAKRGNCESSSTQGKAVAFPDVEPWPEPVVLSQLLDDAADVFARYISLPLGAADAIALWVAHAHTFQCFEHTPRLHLFSPEMRCGKTTLLKVIKTIVRGALKVRRGAL